MPTHRIKALKGARSGHCYVLADGISTRWLDPKHLSEEDVIYVGATPSINGLILNNRAIWVFPEPEVLLNKLFAVVVGLIFRKSLRPPIPFQSWASFGFFRSAYLEVVKQLKKGHVAVHLTNYFGLSAPRKWAIFRQFPKETGYSHLVEPFRGSLNSAVSMALLLGYDEVRLIGFDYLLDAPQSGHWYEEGEPIESPEITGVYQHFFAQFEGLLEIKHVLFQGQSSQIESLNYETVLGLKRSVPNSMNTTVKLLMTRCNLYRMAD